MTSAGRKLDNPLPLEHGVALERELSAASSEEGATALAKALEDAQAQVGMLEAKLQAATLQCQTQAALLRQRTMATARLNRELLAVHQEKSHLEREMQLIFRSKVWRLTAPVRWVVVKVSGWLASVRRRSRFVDS